MRRTILIMAMVTVLSLVGGTAALATQHSLDGCPDAFSLHQVMEHDVHHVHQLVGTATDRNGDGWVCVKHVSVDGDIHVHIDNNVPSRQ